MSIQATFTSTLLPFITCQRLAGAEEALATKQSEADAATAVAEAATARAEKAEVAATAAFHESAQSSATAAEAASRAERDSAREALRTARRELEVMREAEAVATVSRTEEEGIAARERAKMVLQMDDLEHQAAEGRVALETETVRASREAGELRAALEVTKRELVVVEVAAAEVRAEVVGLRRQ